MVDDADFNMFPKGDLALITPVSNAVTGSSHKRMDTDLEKGWPNLTSAIGLDMLLVTWIAWNSELSAILFAEYLNNLAALYKTTRNPAARLSPLTDHVESIQAGW